MRRVCRERFPRHRGLAIPTGITTRVTHVAWCMPGSLTSGFLWSQWRGTRSRHSRCMRNPPFTYLVRGPCNIAYVYGMDSLAWWKRPPYCRSQASLDISKGRGTHLDEFSRQIPGTWNHLCTNWTLLECSYNSTSGIPMTWTLQAKAWFSRNLLRHGIAKAW